VLSGKIAIPSPRNPVLAWGVPGQLFFSNRCISSRLRSSPLDDIVARSFRAPRLSLTASEHVKPSWVGESIGHYEGGDTLVVDTSGLAGGHEITNIDSFRTRHEKLHVGERFHDQPMTAGL